MVVRVATSAAGGGEKADADADAVHPRSGSAIGAASSSVMLTTGPALFSGAMLAVIFNPFDRALFLRVHHRRNFFDTANWRSPFQGFANAAVYRTVCSASYLVWQDASRKELGNIAPGMLEEHRVLTNLLIGSCAGAINGVALNPLQMAKYRMWSDNGGSFGLVVRQMWASGGVGLFYRGVGVSVGRDAAFGVVYEVLRHARLPHGQATPAPSRDASTQFMCNVSAACVASCLSSPLNYCRNVIYGAPTGGCPLRVRTLLTHLMHDWQRYDRVLDRVAHVNKKLNLVWGSMRVGLGMGIGQGLFQWSKGVLANAMHHRRDDVEW